MRYFLEALYPYECLHLISPYNITPESHGKVARYSCAQRRTFVHAYVRNHADVRACIDAYVRAYARMYAPTYARMYARMHARAYVRMYERTSLCARVCVSHVLPRLHTIMGQNRINKDFFDKIGIKQILLSAP